MDVDRKQELKYKLKSRIEREKKKKKWKRWKEPKTALDRKLQTTAQKKKREMDGFGPKKQNQSSNQLYLGSPNNDERMRSATILFVLIRSQISGRRPKHRKKTVNS